MTIISLRTDLIRQLEKARDGLDLAITLYMKINCEPFYPQVQDDRVSIPRPNSECPFERSERVSRAASSISRYSTWWAMDNVSLSYYDNAHQDDDGEHQECVECLSEQRSEIGRTVESDHDSDIETETGKYCKRRYVT